MHALQPRDARKCVPRAQLLGEDAAKTAHFASNLREVFQPSTEPLTMEVAAAALGHLVRSGGALTADVVEFEARALLQDLELDFNEEYDLVALFGIRQPCAGPSWLRLGRN